MVYFCRPGKEPIKHTAGPILPGKTWSEASMPIVMSDGVNKVTVKIDPENKLAESDEKNNVSEIKLNIKNGKIVK